MLPPSDDILAKGSPTISFREDTGLGIRPAGGFSNSRSSGATRDPSVSPRDSKNYDRRESGSASLSHVSIPQSMPRPVSVLSDNSSRTSESRLAAFSPVSPVSSFQPSPIPPAAEFELNCKCGPSASETHIFNSTFSSFSINIDAPSIDTCPDCEMSDNKIQIYETRPQDWNAGSAPVFSEDHSRYKLEWVTRRLVVSHLRGSPQSRVCSSFCKYASVLSLDPT